MGLWLSKDLRGFGLDLKLFVVAVMLTSFDLRILVLLTEKVNLRLVDFQFVQTSL
jgi:hypothetical protein